jgi:hypothetical protein
MGVWNRRQSYDHELRRQRCKNLNATSRLVRLENKNTFFYHEKCPSLLQRRRCGLKFKSRRIGSTFWVENSFFWDRASASLDGTIEKDFILGLNFFYIRTIKHPSQELMH